VRKWSSPRRRVSILEADIHSWDILQNHQEQEGVSMAVKFEKVSYDGGLGRPTRPTSGSLVFSDKKWKFVWWQHGLSHPRFERNHVQCKWWLESNEDGCIAMLADASRNQQKAVFLIPGLTSETVEPQLKTLGVVFASERPTRAGTELDPSIPEIDFRGRGDLVRDRYAAQKADRVLDNELRLPAGRALLGVGTVDGNQTKGRIYSDSKGLWFEAGTFTAKRHEQIVAWRAATGITVTGQEGSVVVTRGHERKAFHVLTEKVREKSTIPAVTEVVIVAGRHHSIRLDASPSRIRGLLGDYIGQVEAQNRTTGPQTPFSGIADEIAKLAKLRDEGVLSEAEFADQKSKLLG
jgi:hypothetical protein